jgi:hypothetical protein
VNVDVFAGPTVAADAVRAILDARVLGPVSFGDVYRSARAKTAIIVVLDGYFERVPAVWHKEILWAMSQGIHVFGASSMGALRAAELADFGMVGIGAIYEAFRSGELEDDDEVAVVHGPPESGFVPLSEAMVNIRATVSAAARAGVIEATTSISMCALAKRRFYAERTYPGLLEDATREGIPPSQVEAFRRWVPSGRVNQKRADAVQVLEHIRDWLTQTFAPKRVAYRFEPTDAWHEAMRTALEASA